MANHHATVREDAERELRKIGYLIMEEEFHPVWRDCDRLRRLRREYRRLKMECGQCK